MALNKLFKQKVNTSTDAIKKPTLISVFYNLFDKDKFYDTNDTVRLNIRIIQILTVGFLLMLLANVMLMILFISIFPLKEKVPYFVTFMPKDEQIVYLEPYKSNKSGNRRVKEFMARDYVKKRETIDQATEEARYHDIFYASNNEIGNDFLNEYSYEINQYSPYKIAFDNNYVRSINIINSEVLNDNQIRVEFEATKNIRTTGQVIETEIIVATVSFTEDKTKYKGNDYLNNPFGYVVADYSLSVKMKGIPKSTVNKSNNPISNNLIQPTAEVEKKVDTITGIIDKPKLDIKSGNDKFKW